MIFYEQTVIDVLDVGVFLKCQKCGTEVHSHVMPKLYCLHIFFSYQWGGDFYSVLQLLLSIVIAPGRL